MDQERGEIRNRERASQLVNFSGVRAGNITPTDLDGLVEYHNQAYFIVELKMEGVEVPMGQFVALQRLCDDLGRSKPHTIVLIARHETPIGKDINAAEAVVEKYRYKGAWKTLDGCHALGDVFRQWTEMVDGGMSRVN